MGMIQKPNQPRNILNKLIFPLAENVTHCWLKQNKGAQCACDLNKDVNLKDGLIFSLVDLRCLATPKGNKLNVPERECPRSATLTQLTQKAVLLTLYLVHTLLI